jgi:multiple sugar transport system substrate-binding protein
VVLLTSAFVWAVPFAQPVAAVGPITVGSNYSGDQETGFEAMMAYCGTQTSQTVVVNAFDGKNVEGYLKGTPDDIFTLTPGYQANSLVSEGLVASISDVWGTSVTANYTSALKAVATIGGQQYSILIGADPWVVMYKKSLFAAKGYSVPTTFADLMALAAQMQTDSLIPFASGDKDGWPAMGTFDILDMRMNGKAFHERLLAGQEHWTDPKVKAVFQEWAQLLPYSDPNATNQDWIGAAHTLSDGSAGMYFQGSFVPYFSDLVSTLDANDLGMFPFPLFGNQYDVEKGIDGPSDGLMMSTNTANAAGAKAILACAATGAAQSHYISSALGNVSVAKDAVTSGYTQYQLDEYAIIQASNEIAQFLDRDTRPDFGGWNGIQPFLQNFLSNPSQDLDAYLAGIQAFWDAPLLSGTVTDPDGNPVANVDVRARKTDNSEIWTSTDGNGQYSFRATPGDYKLWFRDNSSTYAQGCYSSTASGGFVADESSCTPVTVGSSDVTGKDVRLPLGMHITGRITGPGGTPPLTQANASASNGAWADTDSNGDYSIAVLPGDYMVWFNDNSGTGTYLNGCHGATGFTIDWNACTTVTVGPGDATGIDAQMPLGMRITGHVFGPDGTTPLENVNVNANSPSFGAGNNTDGDGYYSLTVAPNGDYTLQFNDNSGHYLNGCYDSNISDSHFTTDQQNSCTPVPVAGLDVGPINVSMPLGVQISGHVYGLNDAPLGTVWVDYFGAPQGAGANTDPDGHYTLAVPPNGSYTLQFNENSGDYVNGCYDSNVSGSHFTADPGACTPVPVITSPVGPYDVSMSTGVHITGHVFGPDGTTPLTTVHINANAGNFGFPADTDNTGFYSLTVPQNGSYTLQFNDNSGTYLDGCYLSGAPGSFTTDQGTCTSVHVTTSDVGPYNVSMSTGVHITGHVFGPDGTTPLTTVHINANAGSFGFPADTDNTGFYSLTVPNGDYILQFNDNFGHHFSGCYDSNNPPTNFTTGQQNLCTSVHVAGSNVTGKDVWMPPAVAISGTVTGPNGPLANIGVRARTGTFETWTNTASDGTYAIAASPGTYKLWFNDNSSTYAQGCYSDSGFTPYENACTPVTVESSDVTGKDVQLPLGLHIAGVVTGAGAQPLANINVNASNGAWANTDNNGAYSIAFVPGDYTLQFNDNSGHHLSGCYLSGAPGNFTTNQSTCTSVPVITSNVGSINVTMSTGLHIVGHVYGPDGTPALVGIWVNAKGPGNSNTGANTDSDGAYSIPVPSGDYTLHFHENNGAHLDGCYLSGATGDFTTNQGTCTSVHVTTSNVGPYDVSMTLGHRITGTVSGPSGPLANISVNANGPGNSNTGANTNSNGAYSIAVLPGDYTISFHDNSGTYVNGCYLSGATGNFTTNPGTCTSVSVTTSDVGSINVTMPSGLHISGRITGPDGLPLTNANANAGNGAWANTDSNGNYSLTVLPGTYTIWFHDFSLAHPDGCYASSSPGHYANGQNACDHVTVTDLSVTGIDVTMPLGHHITGTVSGPGGPLANVNVNANAGSFSFGFDTDAGGTYSILVPSGTYTLNFHDKSGTYVNGCYLSGAPGDFTTGQGTCTPVPVADSDVAPINVTMTLGVHISGHVYGPDGTPALVGIQVGTTGVGIQTDADGFYSLMVPPNGYYTLNFSDNSGHHLTGCYDSDISDSHFTTDWGACTPVPVSGSNVGVENVSMPLGVAIKGTVAGLNGAPLASINVAASSSTSSVGTRTNSDGTYVLAVVPDDDYTVSFREDTGTYVDGCYLNGAPGNFTTDQGICTPVPADADAPGTNVQMLHVTTITWSNPAAIIYGMPLGGTQLNATASVLGDFVYTPPAGTVLGTGNGQPLHVLFTPDNPGYADATATVYIDVTSPTTVITWSNPAAITYGTELSSTQLNATASAGSTPIFGTFDYAPDAGTVLGAGNHQALDVNFTPDNHNYASATATVYIDVTSPTTVITWPNPAAITYGTPLSSTQLNATAIAGGTPITGTFDYTPPAGTVLGAGNHQALDVLFTPADPNYGGGHVTVYINITAKGLTVSGLTASNKVYDRGSTAAITGTGALVGVISPDAVTLTGTAAGTFASANVGTGVPVAVSGLSLGGAQAGNYTLIQPTTTANITALGLTVSAATNTKIYDGTTSAAALPTYTVGTLASGDAAALTETYAFKDVGTALTLIPAINFTSGSATNYSIILTNNTTGVITKATPVITFTSTAPSSAVVSGATYTVTATSPSPAAIVFSIDASAGSICSIAGSVVSFTAVGTCKIDANQGVDTNWNAAIQVQQSFAVGPAATVPGKPTGVTATAGNASALVSWTAPASNGGSAITGYRVTSSPGGKNCTTSGALSCTVSGLTNGQAYTFTVHATNGVGDGPESDPSAAVTPVAPRSGATYHAITPTRVLDTRNGTGGLSGPFTNHAARTFTVGGVPAGAIAVTGNLTVTGQTSSGYFSIGPVATDNPGSSTLNFPVGDDRANAVTVALGGGGTLSITFVAPSNGPTAHAIFDVTGYFTPDTSGATYHALTPTRVLDTRSGTGGLAGPFTNHAARTFTVGGVPPNAIAVTGNLTVTGQTSSGYLSIGPVATDNPGSSTLNFPVGDDRANAVTVALGGGGTLSITFVAPSNGPSAHAIFDVTGYFTPDMSGATYVPLTPTRVLDTRNGTGGLGGPFTNHVARTFTVGGVPAGAIAVTGNLTVTGQTSSGYLFIGPVATNNPTSSTLNFPVGDDRANAVTVALGGGGILSITFVAPSSGPTAHAIFDVTGYFVP